jgi:outer membrane receptor protein involved in Fe transport
MGQLGYDPQLLLSGAAVWNFAQGWHLKANFAQGFRSPTFIDLQGNGAGFNPAGNPNMRNERSNAVQGEVNARVLRNVKRIRELTFRLDYSYSIVDDLVVVGSSGHFENAGRRGIHSVESLAQVFLKGGHELRFSYTFLQAADAVQGVLVSVPTHIFTVGAAFNVVSDRLDLMTTIWLASSIQDPNLDPHPNLTRCIPGVPATPANCGADAAVPDVVLDRTPAPALWNLGLRWRHVVHPSLELSAFVYNVLDQNWVNQDALADPLFEHQPIPGFGRSFMAHLRYLR